MGDVYGKSPRQPCRRMLPALAAAASLHGLLLAAALWFAGRASVPGPGPVLPAATPADIVWIDAEGPGGGGGGGGNGRVELPAPVQRPGHDERPVPAAATPVNAPETSSQHADAVPEITIPAITLAAAAAIVPGVLAAPLAPPTLSRGDGAGDGAGGGDGSGIGPGTGSGLDLGSGGGSGGNVYQPGNGVTMPRPIHVEDPIYPIDAVRARVQGSVLVECVVRPTGVCTDTRVVRSLHPSFGLDREAVAAAQRWRFQPGMRLGEPVSVVVRIEVDFRIH